MSVVDSNEILSLYHTVGLLNTQLHVILILLLLYLIFQPKGNSDIITHMARLVDTITVCISSCFHVVKGIHRIINRALRRKAINYYKFSRPGKIFMGITSLGSWIKQSVSWSRHYKTTVLVWSCTKFLFFTGYNNLLGLESLMLLKYNSNCQCYFFLRVF